MCVTAETAVATVLTKEIAVSCFFMTMVYVDRKPESYGTTYLQTPMIGSSAPAQMITPHLLRNQIFQ